MKCFLIAAHTHYFFNNTNEFTNCSTSQHNKNSATANCLTNAANAAIIDTNTNHSTSSYPINEPTLSPTLTTNTAAIESELWYFTDGSCNPTTNFLGYSAICFKKSDLFKKPEHNDTTHDNPNDKSSEPCLPHNLPSPILAHKARLYFSAPDTRSMSIPHLNESALHVFSAELMAITHALRITPLHVSITLFTDNLGVANILNRIKTDLQRLGYASTASPSAQIHALNSSLRNTPSTQARLEREIRYLLVCRNHYSASTNIVHMNSHILDENTHEPNFLSKDNTYARRLRNTIASLKEFCPHSTTDITDDPDLSHDIHVCDTIQYILLANEMADQYAKDAENNAYTIQIPQISVFDAEYSVTKVYNNDLIDLQCSERPETHSIQFFCQQHCHECRI